MQDLSSRHCGAVSRLAIVTACLTWCLASYAIADSTFRFNIPAEDLGSALKALGAAANEQVLFSEEVVAGLRSPELKGEFTTNAAISILLKGSGLKVERTRSGGVLIRRPRPQDPVTSVATSAASEEADAKDPPTKGPGSHQEPAANEIPNKRESNVNHRGFLARIASLFALSGAAVVGGHAAYGQAAVEASPTAGKDAGSEEITEIVVTGTASGSGIKKLDAGFSITTLNAGALEQMAPTTTSEVLNAVPGIWVESSGGSATSNVFVRGIPSTGDAPFVSMQFNGVTIFGANSPSFMDQLALVRIDETIANVEAVNGGPASVFSDGQPGLTTNLVLKEGHDQTEGVFKITGSSYGLRRLDAEMSGKMAENLYYMIGGYVVSGDTVRKAGFDTEKGSQFTVNITKIFDDGKFNIFARYTDAHGEWFLPFATTVPGLNLGTYNQLNNYNRYATIIVPGSAGSGATENIDLGDGRGWKGVVAGGSLEYDLGGGFRFLDHFGVTSGVLQTMGLVPAGAGAETVTQALLDGHGTPGQTTVQTLHTKQTLAPTDYVQSFGSWLVQKQLRMISNDAAIVTTIADNKITAGYYFSHFSSDDVWSLGNTRWMQVGGDADLVNLNNGTLGAFAIADSGTADINALYLADSWSVTDQFRIDAAVREENQDLKFFINGAGAPAIPGESPNPHLSQSKFSWTVGGNYKLESDLDLYVRASEGYHFPTFDDVRSQLGQSATQDVLDKPWDVKSEEAGVKFQNHSFEADVGVFYDQVRGAVYNDVGVPPVLAGSNAYGVEFDGRWTSDFGLSVTTTDVWENSKSCCSIGDPLVNGKKAERIPPYQVRITPAFRVVNMGTVTADLFATYAAIGKRYGDLQNLQPLPAYDTINAGFVITAGHLSFQLTGDNLGNSHGLTEGNPRSLAPGVPTSLPDLRPIFGRSATASVTARF